MLYFKRKLVLNFEFELFMLHQYITAWNELEFRNHFDKRIRGFRAH